MLTYVRIPLARALLYSGGLEEAASTAESALRFSQALDLGPYLQASLEISAEILSHSDPNDLSQIDAMMKQAAVMVERGHSPWYKIRYLLSIARISLKLDRLEQTQKYLIEVRTIYREMGLGKGTRELWAIEKALEKAERERRK
jgi:hypothetical protein